MRYAQTSDDIAIAYQTVGSGPVTIWMPSPSNIRAQWRVPALRIAYERLSQDLTLVLYDGRGTGSSDRRAGDLGLDAHLRDLEAVIEAVGADRVNLLGYYHAVAAAVAYAAANPQRVDRMLLFGGAARMREAMSPAQTQALLSLVEQDWDLFADAAATAWLGWGSGENAGRVAEAFRTAATPAVARDWFAEAARLDVSDLLEQVVAPTLVLHRQAASQIPVEVSRRLADGVRNGTLVELEGSTPTLFVEGGARDLAMVPPGRAAAHRGRVRDHAPVGCRHQLGPQRAGGRRVHDHLEGPRPRRHPAADPRPRRGASLLRRLLLDGREGVQGRQLPGPASVRVHSAAALLRDVRLCLAGSTHDDGGFRRAVLP